MTDDALQAENLRLRRSIPKDQSLLDAIKRETKRRSKKPRKPKPEQPA